jgi:hypothetical protein
MEGRVDIVCMYPYTVTLKHGTCAVNLDLDFGTIVPGGAFTHLHDPPLQCTGRALTPASLHEMWPCRIAARHRTSPASMTQATFTFHIQPESQSPKTLSPLPNKHSEHSRSHGLRLGFNHPLQLVSGV